MAEPLELLAAMTSLREEMRQAFGHVNDKIDRLNGRLREVEIRQEGARHLETELARVATNVHNLRNQVNSDVGDLTLKIGTLQGETTSQGDQLRDLTKNVTALVRLSDQATGAVWLLRVGASSGLVALVWNAIRLLKVGTP